MSFSAKSQYACLAMLEIARQELSGEPVRARQITERHGIPSPFLAQIMQDLKRAGLVTSERGAAGGYRLSRTASEVTLGDVVAASSGGEAVSECAAADSPAASTLMEVCGEVAAARRSILDGVSLAEFVARSEQVSEPMWYI